MTRRTRQPRRTRLGLHRSGRIALLAAVVTAISLVAAACGGGSNSAGGVKEGGVFRLGSNSTIDSLNPFVAFQADAYVTFEYIYPYLVQYNPKLQFVPDFATSWSETSGGRSGPFTPTRAANGPTASR